MQTLDRMPWHWDRVFAISRYTLLEAWRNRFLAIVLGLVALLYLASLFVKALAITESNQFQVGFFAASMRLAVVFAIAVYILQGLVREFQDKVVELVLSLDLPRATYVLGKFAGYAVLCAAASALCALPLFALSTDTAAPLLWGCSLLLELWLVAAAAVFCMVTFTQLLPAATFVAGFYLLGRSISAIQLMSTSTLLGPDWSTKLAGWIADLIALVLPRLDAFTQTAWLLDAATAAGVLGSAALQVAIYVPLLLGAAMFDLHRRNF
ncbi:MAG TPA: ABC transporter permease [Burkholderiales bacterium]|jgi:ABC-type transport system involved in multi-copper enzyme maturation permease subunit|nr:ABC transporter permease [Burkholderiales bacterium]